MATQEDGKEAFLSRWSRLKRESTQETGAQASAPARPQEADAAAPAPELPPIEKLGIDSDYRAFFDPRVDEGVRRAALKKLFSDPHFNVMDGLDVYVDDYTRSEPIPPAMMAGLRQARQLLDWAKGEERPERPEGAAADPASAQPPAAADPAPGAGPGLAGRGRPADDPLPPPENPSGDNPSKDA